MLYYERELRRKGYNLVIGVDEAGRGPLAGPVVAAAVVLNLRRSFENRIDDSKKLSSRLREKAFWEITGNCAFGVGIVSEKLIDRLNILEATRIAMEEAINSLLIKINSVKTKKIHVIVDGDMTLEIDYPYTAIIKGDAKSKSIASASIVAKVIRDRMMDLYDRIYPQYEFVKHKGYPTQKHRKILKKIGPSTIHRKTFRCA
ncbi:MAG: ribonuclease HII [Candidatus Omnitrophica bacterium]|nr:ribonuclease HII [Candidatus Omnitrophota bacterium]